MTKKEEFILDMMLHFHPESSGGWNIHCKAGQAKLIDKEFKGVLRVVKKDRRKLITKVSEKFKPEHEVIMFRYLMETYRAEENKLYHGIRKLID